MLFAPLMPLDHSGSEAMGQRQPSSVSFQVPPLTFLNHPTFQQVIERIGDVFRIAVPLTLYFALMWIGTFVLFWKLG